MTTLFSVAAGMIIAALIGLVIFTYGPERKSTNEEIDLWQNP